MAENVSFHGDLAQLSGPARCNGCQAGGHRCVFAKDEPYRCISCASVGRDCILMRPLTISAPSSFFSWETLLYREPMTTIEIPSDTTPEQFKSFLAPFIPHGPKNAIVRKYSQREAPRETVREPVLPPPPPAVAAAAAAPVAPKTEHVRPPQSPNDDTIRLQNGTTPSSALSSSPFPSGNYSFTKDNLESLPNEVRRPGLRSQERTEVCDDCRKHRRKQCPPSHRNTTPAKPTPIVAAKPTPVISTALANNNTNHTTGSSVGGGGSGGASNSAGPVTPSESASSPKVQRFPCAYIECEKDFTFMGDLQRHTREIHGVDLDGNPVEPHYCPIEDCTRHVRPFARRDNLRQHLEKRHGMTAEEADNLLVKRPRTGRRSTNVP